MEHLQHGVKELDYVSVLRRIVNPIGGAQLSRQKNQ